MKNIFTGRSKRFWLGLALFVVVLVGGVFIVNAYLSRNQGEKEIKDTMKAVGNIYQLPNEIPEIATVTDKQLLSSKEAFFTFAENGDKVLVFKESSKVLLYRPRTKKIINFSNLNPAEIPGANTQSGQ